MSKKIAFLNDEGISVTATVVDGIDINEEIKKYPANAFIVNQSDLKPREGYTMKIENKAIIWEKLPEKTLDDHRQEQLGKIREVRNIELAKTDTPWIEFASNPNKAIEKKEIEDKKQELRDIPQHAWALLENAQTIEAIKETWPDILPKPDTDHVA